MKKMQGDVSHTSLRKGTRRNGDYRCSEGYCNIVKDGICDALLGASSADTNRSLMMNEWAQWRTAADIPPPSLCF